MIEKLKSAPRAWATAAAIAVVCITGATLALSGTANAAISTYHGTATSGTIKLATGSASARVITNPPVVLDATLDDAAGTVSPTATFTPVYTPTFAGPFGLQLYVRADINQAAAASGPWNPTTGAFSVSAPYHFAVTVFNQAGATQDPATDSKVTDPATCFVDITLDFTGTVDVATGAVTVADSQFDIPAFPAGCGLAQDELNNQLNGPNNSVDLVFAGAVTTTTAPTTTSTTTTTAPTTTSTTTTTAPTTSSTSTTTTTAPTTTTSTSVPVTSSTSTSTSVPSSTTSTTTASTSTTTSVPSTSTTSTSTPGTTIPTSTLPPRDPSTTTPHPPTVPGSPGTSPATTTTTTAVPGTTTSTTVTPTTVEGTTSEPVTAVPPPIPSGDDIPGVTVTAGETITLSGSSCAAGADVTATLEDGSSLGTTTADESGAFSLSITVPTTLAPGDHLATASCEGPDTTPSKVRDAQFGALESTGGVVRQFIRLHVVAPHVVPRAPTPASPSQAAHQLARTGSNSGPLAAIGLGLAMLGGAFVYGSRRTRTTR